MVVEPFESTRTQQGSSIVTARPVTVVSAYRIAPVVAFANFEPEKQQRAGASFGYAASTGTCNKQRPACRPEHVRARANLP